jgi:hypothetical protein
VPLELVVSEPAIPVAPVPELAAPDLVEPLIPVAPVRELAAPDLVDEPVAPDVVAESDLTAAVSPTPPPPPVDMLVSFMVPLAPFCIEPDSIPLPVVPALLLSPRLPLHAVIAARYSEPTIHGVNFMRAPLVCRERVSRTGHMLARGPAPGGDANHPELGQLAAILAILQPEATLVIQRSGGEPASKFEVPAVQDPLAAFVGTR